MKVITVVGNRPQFIKLGVTERALRQAGPSRPYESVVVNTGQHYDQMLSDVFFTELEIAPPAYNLAMGSGHLVDQIGKMMSPLREIMTEECPDAVLVYGDTNSTIAAALVAAHQGIPCIHVEAGERLYRRREMPEEINRIATDHLSELCLTSSRKAEHYLAREGFAPQRVRFVGDPMYELFLMAGRMLAERGAAEPGDFGMASGEYGLATLHRAENTDDAATCLGILEALDNGERPVLLPAHPRLATRLADWGWQPSGQLRLTDPLGYFDFQSLLRQSSFLVTDSGGVGREAFFAGKPAIVPLESSAWIEAVEAGLAVMTGQSPDRIASALSCLPPARDVSLLIEENFGSGDAGERIVTAVGEFLHEQEPASEGAWHSLGRFAELPKALDSTPLRLSNFEHVARALASREGARCILDITESLEHAAELAEAARRLGCPVVPYVNAAAAQYNPFAVENRRAILTIAESELGSPANEASDVLAGWLGLRAVKIDVEGGLTELERSGAPRDLAIALDEDPACREIVVRPWLWAPYPVSPFESGIRIHDRRRDLLTLLAGLGG